MVSLNAGRLEVQHGEGAEEKEEERCPLSLSSEICPRLVRALSRRVESKAWARETRVGSMGPEAIIDKAMGGRFQSHRVN